MLNPKGGTKVTNNSNQPALYTGMVDLTPIMFNPTKEQLIEIKQIPADRQDKVQEPQYFGVDEKGNKFTRLSLLCSYSPREMLKDESQPEKLYIDINFRISKEIDTSSTGSIRIINDRVQYTWAPSIDALKANPRMAWMFAEVDGEEPITREAKVGEVMLYNLISAIYSKVGTKDNPITGFMLSDNPSETFDNIVDGDFDILNSLFSSDSSIYADMVDPKTGNIRKISMLMGVRTDTKINPNTNLPYVNNTLFINNNVRSFAKPGRTLAPDALQAVKDGKFKAIVPPNTNLKFTPFSMEEYMTSMSNASTTTTEITNEADDYAALDTNMLDD